MKRFVELAWNKPISKRLFEHLRNDLRFNEDHKTVFDSVTGHSGTADFHAENTGMDKKKFARVYADVAEAVLYELIRLAEIGRECEIKGKSEKS